MPYKHNAGKRHHIPKAKYRVTDWSEYDEGLRQRGSLTLWITRGCTPERSSLAAANRCVAE